jgi:hypothetical protein
VAFTIVVAGAPVAEALTFFAGAIIYRAIRHAVGAVGVCLAALSDLEAGAFGAAACLAGAIVVALAGRATIIIVALGTFFTTTGGEAGAQYEACKKR